MRNVEYEYKYKVIDLQLIRHKIEDLQSRLKKEFQCIDIYFVVPNNPGGQKYLRVREKNGKAEINFHIAHDDLRTDEWELDIGSSSMMVELLKQLGFKVDVVVDKKRQIFKYLNSEIALDRVKDLGSFVEIESPNEKELLSIATEFGLDERQKIKGSGYPDLLRK